MTETIGIAVCRNFLPELRAIIQRENWKEVVPIEFPASCGRPRLSERSLGDLLAPAFASCRVIHVFGSVCLQDLTGTVDGRIVIHRRDQCFSLVACETLQRVMQREGGYLLTPGWLADWPERMKRDGFDQASAREFFGESIKRLVLLDTRVNQDCRKRFAEFRDYLALPGQIEDVGLNHMTAMLQVVVAGEREMRERRHSEELLRESQKKVSEAMMMSDVLGRLAQTRDESEIVNLLFSFCRMLFSPRTMAFLGFTDDAGAFLNAVPAPGSEEEAALLRRRLSGYSAPYGKTSSEKGYYLRIPYGNEILGVVEFEEFAHQRYIDRYLDLSLRMNPVVGLALANARAYARLLRQIEEIRTLRDEAEKANRAKSEFLANTSHELRNSMNGIIGMSDILAMTPLTDEQLECLACIDISGQNLLTLVNDVIDLSKIEAGRIELETIEFSLRAILQETLRVQNTALLQKRLFARMEVADDVPDRLLGDPLRLKQILLNFLSNAIKFTERGVILLAVEREPTLGLRFSVTDSGIGMAPEALDRLFSPFQQADSTISRKYGGSGLGLAISRKLAELMGGRIWAESRPGQGSTFSCILPFSSAAPTIVVKPRVEQPVVRYTWNGPQLHILMVEDNPIGQKVQVATLYKFGHAVELAENGVQALEMLSTGTYDLVLMDILMPGLDGVETLKRLRANEAGTGRKTPVIALTAQAFAGDRERFLAEGFDGYVTKPIRAAVLGAELKRCLGLPAD